MASVPLIQIDRPKYVGIARLAQQAVHLDDGHKVEFHTLPARSILNRCSAGDRMPFTWTVNPYRGCEFACKYCYARFTHEFMELREHADFERKIFVKQQTAWLLRQEMRKVKRGEAIAIGTATDPYQPAERKFRVTRGLLEEFSRYRGLDIGIVSKSQLMLRDIDLLKKISEHNSLTFHITITTMDPDLARILEPRAPRPDLRMRAVRKLVENGIHAGVICAPVLPEITDLNANLEPIIKAAKCAGARFLFTNPLFLKPSSEAMFLPFLQEHFPERVAGYKQRFAENGYVTASYRKRLNGLVEKLCAKHGMPLREERQSQRSERALGKPEEQLTLF